METYSYLDENMAKIRETIKAAQKSPRAAPDLTLLVATKYAAAEAINYLARRHGVTDIGENRVQELLEKYDRLDRERLRIHFIGKLQRNKVKYIIDKVALIHSLDNVPLAEEIDRRAARAGRVMDALVEVNIGREPNKSGILPEEIDDFLDKISGFSHLRICGIMTMAPKCSEKYEYRKYFRETSRIFIDISQKKLHNIQRPILSMGMSDSYDVAIEEGATLIRVGSAAFSNH